MKPLVLLIALFAWHPPLEASAAGKALIPAGKFRPLFGSEGQDLPVNAFWLDRVAVTNGDFAKFVRARPRWKKGKVSRELADEKYLSHWNKSQPPAADAKKPVVNVSWFAAQEYCEYKDGRLPATLEWEYAAAASKDKADASKDPEFQAKILLWNSSQSPKKGAQSMEPNFYGVSGMHGLIWEWTSDFNAFFVAADNRQDGDQSKNFFCGGGATGAENREQYATFLRYALRSSLQANFTLNSLGIRCAYDHE